MIPDDAQEVNLEREKSESLRSDSDMRGFESMENACVILDNIPAPQFQLFTHRLQSRIDEADEFTANNNSSHPHTN